MSRSRYAGERYPRLTPKRAVALLRVVERVLRPGVDNPPQGHQQGAGWNAVRGVAERVANELADHIEAELAFARDRRAGDRAGRRRKARGR